MSDIQIPIRKFHRLLNYVEAIGLDPRQIADSIGLNYEEVTSLDEDHLRKALGGAPAHLHDAGKIGWDESQWGLPGLPE